MAQRLLWAKVCHHFSVISHDVAAVSYRAPSLFFCFPVANLDLWSGIILTGSVCTLYCTLVGRYYLYMALIIITWLNVGSTFAVCYSTTGRTEGGGVDRRVPGGREKSRSWFITKFWMNHIGTAKSNLKAPTWFIKICNTWNKLLPFRPLDGNNAGRLHGCHHQVCDRSGGGLLHHFWFTRRREAQFFGVSMWTSLREWREEVTRLQTLCFKNKWHFLPDRNLHLVPLHKVQESAERWHFFDRTFAAATRPPSADESQESTP